MSQPPPRPPSARRVTTVGPIAWLRANLFSSWSNTILTLLGLVAHLPGRRRRAIGWAFVNATWEGPDGEACTREGAGACWPFVTARFGQFMYGRYPEAERWRVNLTYVLALAGLVPLMIPRVPGKLWSSIYLLAVFPVLAFILLSAACSACAHVPTDLWGGLLVTLVISSVGIAGRLSASASCWRWGAARACRSCAGCRSASSSSCAACR